MHIERTGQGPHLVLLHGWAMHGGILAPLVAQWSPHFTVHVVDLPGHGHSRDDPTPLRLDAVVAALAGRLPPAVWVGWSLGALVALQAAATHPGQVRALACIAGTPSFVRRDDWPAGVAVDVFRRFGQDLAEDWAATVSRFLALEVQGSDDARADLRRLREGAFSRGAPSPAALAEGLRVLEASDLRAAVAGLRVPSAWIGGRLDLLVPPAAITAAAALAPGGQSHLIAGAGHAPFLQHAPVLAGHVRALAAQAA